MVWTPTDGAGPGGQFHAAEAENWVQEVIRGCGVERRTLSMTVTGSDMVVTIPAFNAVVPDGSGSFVLIEKTAATNVTISAADATDPRVDIITVDASGNVTATAGTPTAESGSVVEAPMPSLASDEILLAKVKVGNGVTTIGTDKVFGRAVYADIYRTRYLAGWVADDATNPNLVLDGSNNLPVGAFVEIPFLDVTEAFDAGGLDQITIGYDADNDAFGLVVNVDAVGVKNVTAGAEHGYVATARAVEAYYTNTGAAPSAGKALVIVPWHFAPPIVS
jgi:hypothetical protein